MESSSSTTPPAATTRSRALRASRTDPAPAATTWSTTSSVTSKPASADTKRTCSARASAPSRPRSKTWQRLRIVSTTLWGSVVASTQTTWSGGSSRVFSRAFSAPGVSMWASSSR